MVPVYYSTCTVKTTVKYNCIVFYIRTVLVCYITHGYTKGNLEKAGAARAAVIFSIQF